VTESLRQAETEDVPKADAAEGSISTTESVPSESREDTGSEKKEVAEVDESEAKSGDSEAPTDLKQAAKEGERKMEESSSS